MRILYIVSSSGVGGHTRSAITIAKSLERSGVKIHFAAGDCGGGGLVRNCGLEHTILPTGFSRGYLLSFAMIHKFKKTVEKVRPNIFHAFDIGGLALSYYFAKQTNSKLLFTICGGPTPNYRVPNMCPIVVFSDELKTGIMQKYEIPEKNISVNGARIDCDINTISLNEVMEYKQKLGIPLENKVILVISRITQDKLPFFLHLMDTAQYLFKYSKKLTFLIIGKNEYNNNAYAYQKILSIIDNIKLLHGQSSIILSDQESQNASYYLPLGDLLVGSGRTALEAISVGLPSVIVGNYGFSGIAQESNCDLFSETNFSGRCAKDWPKEVTSPSNAANAVNILLTNQDYYKRIIVEARKWLNAKMDVKIGSEFYSKLYRSAEYSYPSNQEMFKFWIYYLCQNIYKNTIPNCLLQSKYKKKFNDVYAQSIHYE